MTPRMQITWNVLEAAKDASDETIIAACRRIIIADRIGWRKHGNAADLALLTVSTWQRRASTVTVRLYHLDGRPWASAGFLSPFQPGAKWDWIRETVAAECECDPDQVGCIESDDGDLIMVDGMPCYRVEG